MPMTEDYKLKQPIDCQPSPRVLKTILSVAKVECEIIARGKRVRLRTPYQHIPYGDMKLKVCLN